MKIFCLADVHSRFAHFAPENAPDADLCIIAGDVTDYGVRQQGDVAAASRWLAQLAARFPAVVWIPGNHDIGLDENSFAESDAINLLWRKRQVDGLWLYGVSCCTAYDFPELASMWWYMTANRDKERAAYDFDPVDIVVSHSPPLNCLDYAGALIKPEGVQEVRIGSPCLRDYIEAHQPKLVVCGHEHGDGGKSQRIGETLVVNCAQRPMLVEIAATGAKVI